MPFPKDFNVSKIKDITGFKSHKLTAIRRVGSNNHQKSLWLCQCECGNTKIEIASHIIKKIRISCGCENKKYGGLTNTYKPLYRVWSGMIYRCYDPRCRNYKHYGGRGILTSAEWKSSFLNFLEWAKDKWQKGLDLDRINNNGHYEAGNCRFVTRKANCRNTRKNRFIEYNGETLCISEWCEKLSLTRDVFLTMIKNKQK